MWPHGHAAVISLFDSLMESFCGQEQKIPGELVKKMVSNIPAEAAGETSLTGGEFFESCDGPMTVLVNAQGYRVGRGKLTDFEFTARFSRTIGFTYFFRSPAEAHPTEDQLFRLILAVLSKKQFAPDKVKKSELESAKLKGIAARILADFWQQPAEQINVYKINAEDNVFWFACFEAADREDLVQTFGLFTTSALRELDQRKMSHAQLGSAMEILTGTGFTHLTTVKSGVADAATHSWRWQMDKAACTITAQLGPDGKASKVTVSISNSLYGFTQELKLDAQFFRELMDPDTRLAMANQAIKACKIANKTTMECELVPEEPEDDGTLHLEGEVTFEDLDSKGHLVL